MTKWFKWKSARVWILLFLCAAVGFGPDSAGAGQKAATRLDFIRTTSKENHLVIHFEADGTIKDYKASTKEDPPRIVFDLYGIETKREGLQKVTVEDVHARGIRYQGFIDKVRVVVDTETQYLEQYKVTEVDGGLQVRIGDASVTQAEKAPASAATPMEEPRAAEPVDQGQTPVTHFESIQTESKETYLDVHLKADGPIKKYKVFSYDDPATIVIDLFGVRDRLKGPHKLPLEDRHARRVRYGVHPDKVRVVLDTETQYLKQYQVMAVDGGLQVRIGDASGTQSQKAPAPAASPAAVKRAAVAAKDGQTPTTASERIPTRSQKPAAPTFTTEANTMESKTDSREQPVVAPKLRAAPASSSRTPPTDAGALQEPDTDALIELLMQKGVISEQEADKLKKKAPIPRPSTLGEEPVIYIVPDVPDAQKQKIVKEIADQSREDIQRIEQKTTTRSEDILQRQRVTERDVEELERKISDIDKKTFKSEWAQRIRFGGDIRLRYERIGYDDDNALILDPNDPDALINTTEDRNRFRYRARLGAKAKIVDPRSSDVNVGQVDVGLRMAVGNDDTPVSTNNTFGNYWLNGNAAFDQAYLRYTYRPDEPLWADNIPQVRLTGGRLPNPWFHTDLLWDSDLNFEGVVLDLATDTQDMTKWKGFVTLGAFPLQEDAFTSDCDKYLYAGQIGVEYKPRYDLTAKLRFAYYDYVDIEGKPSPADQPTLNECTAPLFFQKGNTLFDIDPRTSIEPALAADYNLFNVTGKLDLGMFHPVHINFIFDYVKNTGFDKDDVEFRTGTDVDRETTGYQLGIEVGHPAVRDFLDWNVFLYYKYLEADAVVDAFTDSDFHDGGTNAKGWILGGEVGLYHNVSGRIRWLTTDEISGPPLAIDTLQMDINARF